MKTGAGWEGQSDHLFLPHPTSTCLTSILPRYNGLPAILKQKREHPLLSLSSFSNRDGKYFDEEIQKFKISSFITTVNKYSVVVLTVELKSNKTQTD